MALEVIMPKAGVDMTEGQIVQWNKKVGEFVKEGEILLEIMTDKVSMELEAEEDGYLIAILKGDGETVPVHLQLVPQTTRVRVMMPLISL